MKHWKQTLLKNPWAARKTNKNRLNPATEKKTQTQKKYFYKVYCVKQKASKQKCNKLLYTKISITLEAEMMENEITKKKEIERVMFGNILKIESIGVNFGVNY